MTDEELGQIAFEIQAVLAGRKFGRLFPLSRGSFAVDFYPHSGAYLFIDTSSRYRSIYLIVRKLKLLERESVNPSRFQLRIRQMLSGLELVDVIAIAEGIVLRLQTSDGKALDLVAAVKADPANLLVVDHGGNVLEAFRETGGMFSYTARENLAVQEDHDLSAALDKKRIETDEAKRFAKISAEARKRVSREIAKRQKLLANLDNDLEKHGQAEIWKKYADLILASLPNPITDGENYQLIDLFDADQPEILIPTLGEDTPKATAEKYYRNYRKAVNAVEAIASRKLAVRAEISKLEDQLKNVEASVERGDIAGLQRFLKPPELVIEKPKKQQRERELKGVRRFASSNGFEILVGKKSTDNDTLTFRIAKSLDTWLHAADYPGSHVVIRNPNRKEIPQQTLVEAASIAAFYSDARELPKAAVNYTQRKFVNKPKRAAPGLVSLSSFKTLVIKPEIPEKVEKILV